MYIHANVEHITQNLKKYRMFSKRHRWNEFTSTWISNPAKPFKEIFRSVLQFSHQYTKCANG